MSQTCWPPAQSEMATSPASRAPIEIKQVPLEPICLRKTRLLKRIWIKKESHGPLYWDRLEDDFVLSILGIEHRASHTLGKCSTTELYP